MRTLAFAFLITLNVGTVSVTAQDREILTGPWSIPERAETCKFPTRGLTLPRPLQQRVLEKLTSPSEDLNGQSPTSILRSRGLVAETRNGVQLKGPNDDLLLIPLRRASSGESNILVMTESGDEFEMALLTFSQDLDGSNGRLVIADLLDDERIVVNLAQGSSYLERNPKPSASSSPGKSVASVVSCLFRALFRNFFSPGDLACTWSSVAATCVTNFSQCLGAVQAAFQELACASGVNLLVDVLHCFDSTATAPTITSLTPSDGSNATTPLTISCSASDSDGISELDLLFDASILKTCAGTASCSFTYAASVTNGTHAISCTARDNDGHSITRTNSVNVSNGGGGGGTTDLQNDVPVGNVVGAMSSQRYFRLAVPTGATSLEVTLAGGSGDADLYVRRGQQPTTSTYDCRSTTSTNSEICTIPSPAGGDWYFMVYGYHDFNGVTIKARYTTSSATTLQNDVPVTNLSGSAGTERLFRISVPSGRSQLVVTISGSNGDADLYVRRAQVPTADLWDCRPYSSSSSESCSFSSPASGDWYVSIRGYTSYSGVTLRARYN